MNVVLKIHKKWICCTAEWQNFREDDSGDRNRRAVSCPLGIGMLFVA